MAVPQDTLKCPAPGLGCTPEQPHMSGLHKERAWPAGGEATQGRIHKIRDAHHRTLQAL